MRKTRSTAPWALLTQIACGLLLTASGFGLAYQDGRLHGWMPGGPTTPASTDGDGDHDGVRSDLRLDGLRLPDLRTRSPSGIHVVDERSEGGPVRLKFTTLIWNAGAGPLEVRGDPDDAVRALDGDGGLEVEQYAVDADGRWHAVGPVGTFDFEHRHGHLHLSGFADYELWTLPDAPPGEPGERRQPGRRIAQNVKIGFCLMDNVVVDEAMASDEAAYGTGCEAEVQGISPGYGDLYAAELYEQDIDVTEVPDGRYRLVNVANPHGVLLESDETNNASYADLELRTAADGQRFVASVP